MIMTLRMHSHKLVHLSACSDDILEICPGIHDEQRARRKHVQTAEHTRLLCVWALCRAAQLRYLANNAGAYFMRWVIYVTQPTALLRAAVVLYFCCSSDRPLLLCLSSVWYLKHAVYRAW
jgi:hypothetical protein